MIKLGKANDCCSSLVELSAVGTSDCIDKVVGAEVGSDVIKGVMKAMHIPDLNNMLNKLTELPCK